MNNEINANLISISNRIKQFTDKHPDLTVPIAKLLLSMIGFAEVRRSNGFNFGPHECIGFMEKNKPKEITEDLQMNFLAIHKIAMIINTLVSNGELSGIEEYLNSLIPPKKVGPLEEFLRKELNCLPPKKNLGMTSFFMSIEEGRYPEDFILTDSRIEEERLDKAIEKYYQNLGGKVDFTKNPITYFKTKINDKSVAGIVTNADLIRITIHEY